MLKRLTFITLTAFVALVAKAVIVPDTIGSHFVNRPVTPIEGVWQFADDGATLAVYSDSNTAGDYTIVCMESPDLRLPAGTVLGTMSSSLGDGEHYSAMMYTDVSSSGVPIKQHKFTVTVKNGTLEMAVVKSGLKLDLWMLYRFFITMSLHRNSENKNLRARRVYPNPTPTADNPTVL